MKDLSYFYSQLKCTIEPDEEISLTFTREGSINIINGDQIKFKFYKLDSYVNEYQDKLPKDYDTSFLRYKKLSLLVPQAKSGDLTFFPIFTKMNHNDDLEKEFEMYSERGKYLKRPSSELNEDKDSTGKAYRDAVESLCQVASKMAKRECFTAICTPSYSGKTHKRS